MDCGSSAGHSRQPGRGQQYFGAAMGLCRKSTCRRNPAGGPQRALSSVGARTIPSSSEGIQAQGKPRVEWKPQVKRQMVLDEPLQNPVTRISWKHSPVPLGSSLTYLIRALWNLYPGEHPRYVPNRTESFPGGMFNTVSLWWWKALADRGHSLT